MTGIEVILDGYGALKGRKVVESSALPKILCLHGGMESGLPSVAFVIELPDGSAAFCQTSARAFLAAARAIAGRFPQVAETLGGK